MTRRSRLWFVAATIFTALNLGAAGLAAVQREGLHTAGHVALMLVGAWFMWRIASRVRGQPAVGAHETDERLDHLQQSVDAIALEVERIGEAQRFITKIAAERVDPPPRKPQP